MASYAMAHTKLEMVLRDSGCELDDARLRIYLTNSLEEHHPDTGTLFSEWLADEANEANFIKRDTPVMVVIGNPPYAVSSSNKGDWINNLIADYKKNLNERKINLDDDYIKFIRYGEHLIEKTGYGILAYISNNSFLDGVTHRQMRKHLLETFDKIYIVDLHGNARKRETTPDGSQDKNVFDIMQGVSINIFIKTATKKNGTLAKVFHCDLYGERKSKYDFFWEHDLKQIDFKELQPIEPYYFFVPKDFSAMMQYEKGFGVNKLFDNYNSGIQTKRDKLTVALTDKEIANVRNNMLKLNEAEIREKYQLPEDGRDWKIGMAKNDIQNNSPQIQPFLYRPFDTRYTLYTGKTKGFLAYPRHKTMHHFLAGANLGLLTSRSSSDSIFNLISISRQISDIHAVGGQSYCFPLYLYPDTDQLKNLNGDQQREPNLDDSIVQTIAENLGLRFTPEAEDDVGTFAPIDLLDYIYAVLHSPAYRERYKEFLKIDFPRVPYPTEQKQFRQLVKLGGELRTLHLMESPTLDNLITGYNEPGDNIVGKPEYKITDHKNRLGQVHINKTQHFSDVPETAWNFYIGGYQPAQKWLKDRKGRTLTSDDIGHYQKIIVALTETERLMKEIDTLWQPPPD